MKWELNKGTEEKRKGGRLGLRHLHEIVSWEHEPNSQF